MRPRFALPPLLSLALVALCACRGRAQKDAPAAPDLTRALSPDETSLTPAELLGKRLFEDATLSSPPGVACASCHDAAHAFQGNNDSRIPAVARGSQPETFGTRNSPSLLYASFAPPFTYGPTHKENATSKLVDAPMGGLFWDGRASTLSEQAREPLFGAREMNIPSAAAFVSAVRASPYAALAAGVVGPALADPERGTDALLDAIAAFERTPRFHPFRSKFDDSLRGAATLSASEARGFALFKDPYKGNCISCHAGKEGSTRPEDWLFTDYSYSSVGAPRNAAIPVNADPAHFDLGLCDRPTLAELLPSGADARAYCGFFRVPTLRNVAVTAPYMHNGAFAALRDVVRFYGTRDTNVELWYPTDAHFFVHVFDDLPFDLRGNVSTDEVPYDRFPGQAPLLDVEAIDDVVAFLGTLTDR